ncbi:MAG: protein kinase [Deltaproteobacteria bacterium]|jgi:CRP-like cAMP-binding protein|nr:protein kinase [Deltaproteobacteria bacterium]
MNGKASTPTRVFGGLRGIDAERRKRLEAIKSGFASPGEMPDEDRAALELDQLRPGLVIEHHVGEGGSAAVYAALDHGLERRVAVKIIHPSPEPDERAEARFVEEAQLTGQLEHPNIVPIHEIGATVEGRLYFGMKLVSGRALSELLAERPPGARDERDLRERVKILVKVCDALAFAHAHGVVHRDLKPENILVGEFGEVYVMDWGIALRVPSAASAASPASGSGRFAATQPLDRLGTIIGTPEYMAPEQALGDTHRIEPRTDVFGLGAMLYALLTGCPPHREKDDDATILAAQDGVVVDPRERCPELALPPALAAIAMRALSAEIADRHPSARAFQDDLERYLRGGDLFPERTFAAGEWIVREGDEADCAFVIVSGACEAGRVEDTGWVVLRRMEAGEVFGETAIFAESRRSASVRAAAATRVTVVPRDALLGNLEGGSWTTPFVRTLAQRFAEQSREVSELHHRTAVAEVGLLAVHEIAARATAGGLEADLAGVIEALTARTPFDAGRLRVLLGESAAVVIEGARIRVRVSPHVG